MAAAGIAAGGAVLGGLGSLMGGKSAQKAADKAVSAQDDQMKWVKSLFGERKADIKAVSEWANDQGLLDPKALFDRIDTATATTRARDQKNLVNSLFKQGGYRPGETAAEGVLGRAELAHANARDQEYLSMAVDAFGRRLALAGAPYETGLIGQTLQAGAQSNALALDNAQANRAGSLGALGGLAGAWSRYQSFMDAQKQASGPVGGVWGQGGDMGLGGANQSGGGQQEGPGGVLYGGFG